MIENWYTGHIVICKGIADKAIANARKANDLVLCARSCLTMLATTIPELSVVVPASIDLVEIDELSSRFEWSAHRSILAVGAGSVTDVAKLLAARHELNLTVVPTVLSCNAFATEKSVVGVAGRHVSVMTRPPQHVYIDPYILARTDLRWHLLGLADALSTYTALFDWHLAAEQEIEPIDQLSASWSQSLCISAFAQIDTLLNSRPIHVYEQVARMLALSGMITNFYGSGRPESGSEHRIARVIEQHLGPGKLWHGEAVLIGMLLATTIQGQSNTAVYDFAAALELGPRLNCRKITPEVLASYLLEARSNRTDRFTILDVVSMNKHDAEIICCEVLRKLESARTRRISSRR